MTLHGEIIEKILSEVDEDIRTLMLREETRQGMTYKGYELVEQPALVILQWQSLRNKNGTGTDN